MAKKKVSTTKPKKVLSGIAIELIGISIIFLSILIMGQLGIVGSLLKQLFLLFVGEFYWIVAIYAIFISVKMMISREVVALFKKQYMGVYLIFIAVVLFSHLPVYRFFLSHDIPLMSGVVNYYWGVNILETDMIVGGGVMGALLYALTVPLISANGLYALSFVMLLYGVLMMCDVSLKDVFEFTKEKSQALFVIDTKPIKKASSKKVKEKPSTPDEFVLMNDGYEFKEEPSMNQAERFTARFASLVEDDELQDEHFVETKAVSPEKPRQESLISTNESIKLELNKEKEMRLVEAHSSHYQLPPLDLLNQYTQTNNAQQMIKSAKINRHKLEETFKNFGVKVKVVGYETGPAVTRFEILPDVGVKVSKVLNLTDDIALALAAKGLRIEAPIPGKSAIGIEVPNPKQTLVTFKEILQTVPEKVQQEKLLMVLGKGISGETVYAPLNRMPHLLVAGATGAGKSVCINTIICSIIMRATEHEVKLLMVDPKKVELNGYNGIPHLLAPVVTDARLASLALKKVVSEMEYRYDLFSQSGTRNIEGYNEYVKSVNERGEEAIQLLPFIVVIIDELADLMMVASKEVEECIMRLTQMARAAGIHLIIATQRPSVDVITGVIKANIPSRIAFGVSSAVDSRTIIDTPGAEKLLGKGDMLFVPMGSNHPTRVQGAFISDEEVARIVTYIKDQVVEEDLKQDFLENIEPVETKKESQFEDPLINEVLVYMVEIKKISASLIQRHFRVGYNRAARIIDELEAKGMIGPSEGSKPREVLISERQLQELR